MKRYLIIVIGCCFLAWVWMNDQDFHQRELERKIRSSFLIVRGLLDLPTSSRTSLTDLVNDALKRGAHFNFAPQSTNPLPTFLPDYQYSVFADRDKAKDGVLIKARIEYWLRSDKDVILFWDGKITGVLNWKE